MDNNTQKLIEQLRDIRGFHAIEIPLWLIILSVLLLLTPLAYWIYRKFFTGKPAPDLSNFDFTVQQINKLDIKLPSKIFYLRYSELLKSYLEKELAQSILDKTPYELKPILTESSFLSSSEAINLIQILERGELAKFAKYDIDELVKAEDIAKTLMIITHIHEAKIQQELMKQQQDQVLIEEALS